MTFYQKNFRVDTPFCNVEPLEGMPKRVRQLLNDNGTALSDFVEFVDYTQKTDWIATPKPAKLTLDLLDLGKGVWQEFVWKRWSMTTITKFALMHPQWFRWVKTDYEDKFTMIPGICDFNIMLNLSQQHRNLDSRIGYEDAKNMFVLSTADMAKLTPVNAGQFRYKRDQMYTMRTLMEYAFANHGSIAKMKKARKSRAARSDKMREVAARKKAAKEREEKDRYEWWQRPHQ
jgi:hypothetical protein